MNVLPTRAIPAHGFGPSPASVAGQAVAGLGDFSQAAYRHADEIRRGIVVPAAPGPHGSAGAKGSAGATGSAATGAAATTLSGALAGFLSTPAGHSALIHALEAGAGFLKRAFGAVAEAEQLALPFE